MSKNYKHRKKKIFKKQLDEIPGRLLSVLEEDGNLLTRPKEKKDSNTKEEECIINELIRLSNEIKRVLGNE